ncbi:DNA-binding barrel domain superfamily, partial [Sesbania bispinosa]
DFKKIPSLFTSEYADELGNEVVFIDPVKNEIHYCVRKYMYFSHRWKRIKDIYDLGEGGWLKFTYLDDNDFKMRVFDRDLVEVHYPLPATDYPLAAHIDPDFVPFPGYVPPNFDDILYYDKQLTEYTASKYSLVIF